MTIDSCNLAAVDVGSNAARLLIKHVDTDDDGKTEVSKLLFLRIPLRLGMDVFTDGKISKSRTREFVDTMKAYRQLMKVYGIRQYRACATSAMREAKNGKQVIRRIRRKAHLALEIISGDEESRIIYENHIGQVIANDPSQAAAYLYVDVGGGSTEVSFIRGSDRLYSHSFNVGTIRLLKEKVKREDIIALKEEISRVTKDCENVRIIGSGGNINKLFRLASKKKNLRYLPVETLRKEYDKLSKMSVEERIAVYSLKPDRADVIVPAAEIFLHVAESAGASIILVPNLGLADGIISEMVASQQRQNTM